mmetsp:Transcript_23242/g.27983  ORF Transcript_23242/g.27983 Transcript_23242/m.27983 type:complete len:80 (-) Transcript_23242:104-343(-)
MMNNSTRGEKAIRYHYKGIYGLQGIALSEMLEYVYISISMCILSSSDMRLIRNVRTLLYGILLLLLSTPTMLLLRERVQ